MYCRSSSLGASVNLSFLPSSFILITCIYLISQHRHRANVSLYGSAYLYTSLFTSYFITLCINFLKLAISFFGALYPSPNERIFLHGFPVLTPCKLYGSPCLSFLRRHSVLHNLDKLSPSSDAAFPPMPVHCIIASISPSPSSSLAYRFLLRLLPLGVSIADHPSPPYVSTATVFRYIPTTCMTCFPAFIYVSPVVLVLIS